ncbi:M48 family metalloprotease [Halosimplex halophilum]|uniref:M48 family metalloprotease n=1 Tax=Halosimplex halophilum TaxID=2559572 RepID=UPI00107F1605|nr:M48 family metalloprotease [Halosimplex halophilum]
MLARYPALQSSVDTGAVVDSLGALAAGAAVGGLVLYLYGLRARGAEDRVAALARLRRAVRAVLVVVYAGTVVALLDAGWFLVVDAVAAPLVGTDTPVASAVTLYLGVTTPLVAVIGAYFGAFPAAQSLRGTDVSPASAALRLARFGLGTALYFTVLVVAMDTLETAPTAALPFVAVLALGLVAVWATSPWLVRLTRSTRPPTDAERDRLGRLCDEAGLAPHSVRVLEGADAKQAFAFARGPPRRQHLFVTDYLLDELDDGTLRAYLALRAERVDRKHLEVRLALAVGTAVLALGPLLGVFSVPGASDGTVALVALAAGLLGLWAGQRLVYRADAAAAERTSRAAVETAIERYADLNDARMEWGRLTSLRRMEPPLRRRIDRLRDRAARE